MWVWEYIHIYGFTSLPVLSKYLILTKKKTILYTGCLYGLYYMEKLEKKKNENYVFTKKTSEKTCAFVAAVNIQLPYDSIHKIFCVFIQAQK